MQSATRLKLKKLLKKIGPVVKFIPPVLKEGQTPQDYLMDRKIVSVLGRKPDVKRAWMEIEFTSTKNIKVTSPKGGVVKFTFNQSQELSRCMAKMFQVIQHFEKKNKGDGYAKVHMSLDQINELVKFK